MGEEMETENKELNVEETVADDATEKAAKGSIVEKCPVSSSEDRKDVTYVRYQHETYESRTCGMTRGYNVILPADYDESKQYPVLYLLHGIFGDENSFRGDPQNKIPEIFGNLAADGEAREWIVVTPNMYATDNPNQKPGFDAKSVLPYDNFVNDLVNDLMPEIENRYAVLKGRENTAIAGFSMGGRETLYITLLHPELFGYSCAISPAPGLVPGKDWAMEHVGSLKPEDVVKLAAGMQKEKPMMMITCGDSDKTVGQFPKSYHELFEKAGIDHIWYEVPGADHDNTAIRSGLYNFLVQIGD